MTAPVQDTALKRTAAQPLTLDERLALTSLAMDARLGGAGVAMDVRTAPIDIPDIAVGHVAQLDGPLAGILHRAQHRLATAGWSRHTAIDDTGAMCPLHAIHLEADSDRQEGEARSLLLEAIRRESPYTAGIPHWNSQQPGPGPALRMLGAAAQLAEQRGL